MKTLEELYVDYKTLPFMDFSEILLTNYLAGGPSGKEFGHAYPEFIDYLKNNPEISKEFHNIASPTEEEIDFLKQELKKVGADPKEIDKLFNR